MLYAQSGIIELKVPADLRLSRIGDVLGIQSEVVDGFAYKFPFTIKAESDQIELSGLTADSICNCVRVRFERSVLSKSANASGEIFLRPKLGQLVEGVQVRGFRDSGGGEPLSLDDNVAFVFALKVKVISPVEISERHLVVEDGKLLNRELKLNVADGVSIKALSGATTDSSLRVVTDPQFSHLTLIESKPLTDGRVLLDFDLEKQGVRGKFTHQIAFGERLKTRIVPSILFFDKQQNRPQQTCLVVGPELLAGNLDDLRLEVLVQPLNGSEWIRCSITPEIASNGALNADKAILRLRIDDKKAFEGLDSWKIRIVDRSQPGRFVDVDCKWRGSSK